jgi:hypothetical protein
MVFCWTIAKIDKIASIQNLSLFFFIFILRVDAKLIHSMFVQQIVKLEVHCALI